MLRQQLGEEIISKCTVWVRPTATLCHSLVPSFVCCAPWGTDAVSACAPYTCFIVVYGKDMPAVLSLKASCTLSLADESTQFAFTCCQHLHLKLLKLGCAGAAEHTAHHAMGGAEECISAGELYIPSQTLHLFV